MTSALRWAATRAILMFHNCEGRGEGGKGDMEVGVEGDYIPIATLSPPE